jgi:dihydrodipicolinate synthase/N-acetylneuraminate lyase
MGSNGEAVSLGTEEKVELCRAVRELSKPSHVIIAGTGCHGKNSHLISFREMKYSDPRYSHSSAGPKP